MDLFTSLEMNPAAVQQIYFYSKTLSVALHKLKLPHLFNATIQWW